MRGLASSISTAIALMALACAWSLAGCGGNDNSGASNQPSTNASAKNDSSGGGGEAGTAQSEPGDRATRAGSQSPSGSAPVTPVGPEGTGQDQQAFPQALRHPKGTNEPHKPHKSHSSGKSGGNSTAGLTPQESAAYETARALCANPDSLQYAPEEIRDDAEALAEFAERFAPPGEEQIVHDGCLVGLKSIGIG